MIQVIEDSALMRIVADSSQEECREMGKLLLELAERPRDVQWTAMFRERAAPRSQKEINIAEALDRGRMARDFMRRGWVDIGLGHSKLVNEEMTRRGEDTRYDDLRSQIGERAWQAVRGDNSIYDTKDQMLDRVSGEQGPG